MQAIPYAFHFFHLILSYHHCHAGALVKQDNPCLDWGNWAIGEPDSSGVILLGWPLQQQLTALSHIRNLHDMNTILNAITQQDCRLELVKNPDKDPQSTSGTHFPSITYVVTVLAMVWSGLPVFLQYMCLDSLACLGQDQTSLIPTHFCVTCIWFFLFFQGSLALCLLWYPLY